MEHRDGRVYLHGEPYDAWLLHVAVPTVIMDGATLDDWATQPTEGQVELVDGQLWQLPLHGGWVGYVVGNIVFALLRFVEERDEESALVGMSRLGYVVDLPHRKSFCADASYMPRPFEKWNDYPIGAPRFAVEVRDLEMQGGNGDAYHAAKRADYFAAGAEVVWDVNPWVRTVAKYVRGQDAPVIWHDGDEADADAEPAVPGWRIAIADVFER